VSLPYFPMYPTDFEAKTSHLTLAEDGAYNRLLRICWMTPGCSIPNDDAWIMRRLRVDQDTFDGVVKVVIDEFFDSEKGRLSNPKLTRIFIETNEAHQKRVSAGSKGGKAKSLNVKKTRSSNAVAKPKQPEPEPELSKRDTNVSTKNGTRLPDDWFLSASLGQWSTQEGATEELVRREADKFKDYWKGVAGAKGRKADWDATWRNWIRKAIADAKPQFKAITGGRNGQSTNKSEQRVSSFVGGARGAS